MYMGSAALLLGEGGGSNGVGGKLLESGINIYR